MSWDEKKHKFISCAPDSDFFTEKEIQKLARDIIRGLDYIHRKSIIHRDIKPQNIMLDERGLVKIGDFGSAEKLNSDDDTFTDSKGTYFFFAPEQWDPDIKEYSGKAADIWAFGITLYSLVFNVPPFYAENELKILEKINSTKLEISSKRNISEGLENLILRWLDKDPETRIKMEDLRRNTWVNEGFHWSLDSKGKFIFEKYYRGTLYFQHYWWWHKTKEIPSLCCPLCQKIIKALETEKWAKKEITPRHS